MRLYPDRIRCSRCDSLVAYAWNDNKRCHCPQFKVHDRVEISDPANWYYGQHVVVEDVLESMRPVQYRVRVVNRTITFLIAEPKLRPAIITLPGE